ncbi:helix-turn-helix domain-containing protein [Dongshaea marina]|uniref:helix-turn-helix domain-containing protein n=1 Tax=Dongshaea marina TaxID=2047966 RepID=UPI000D3E46BF|nr:helix-turn-helix domain-containing protein [Dongshaea marina]
MYSSNNNEQRRFLAVYLHLQKGYSQSQTARAIGVSQGSISLWCKQVRSEGLGRLKNRPHTGRKPQLDSNEIKELFRLLKQQSPAAYDLQAKRWSSRSLSKAIWLLKGVKYSHSRVNQLMKHHGFNPKKDGDPRSPS